MVSVLPGSTSMVMVGKSCAEVGYWDVGPWTCTVKADTAEPKWPWLDFIENDSFEFQLISVKE